MGHVHLLLYLFADDICIFEGYDRGNLLCLGKLFDQIELEIGSKLTMIKLRYFVEVYFLWNRTVDSLKTSFHPLLWTSSGLRYFVLAQYVTVSIN